MSGTKEIGEFTSVTALNWFDLFLRKPLAGLKNIWVRLQLDYYGCQTLSILTQAITILHITSYFHLTYLL